MPRGVYVRTEEYRKKLSEGQKGKHNIKHSDEAKAKISAAKTGLKASEETRRKMTESQRLRYSQMTPEEKATRAAKIATTKQAKPHKYTDEQLARMSEAQKAYNSTLTYEEYVLKRAKNIKALRDANHRMPTSDTKIELFVDEFLREAGIEFEHPYQVGVLQADFYIPAINTIVEVQGCYWHGCEKCGFTGEDFFEEQRTRDKRRFGYLAAEGFKIRTVWEHEIKKKTFENLLKLVG